MPYDVSRVYGNEVRITESRQRRRPRTSVAKSPASNISSMDAFAAEAGGDPLISKLHNIVDERKNIETRCQTLENRIQLLKLEADKIKTSPKGKSVTIPALRKTEENNATREARKTRQVYEEQQRAKILARKSKSRDHKYSTMQNAAEERRRAAMEVRAQREEIRIQCETEKQQAAKEAIEKRNSIVKMKAQGFEKRVAYEKQKLQDVKHSLVLRVSEEEQQRIESEKRVRKLELLEKKYLEMLEGQKNVRPAVSQLLDMEAKSSCKSPTFAKSP